MNAFNMAPLAPFNIYQVPRHRPSCFTQASASITTCHITLVSMLGLEVLEHVS
jgi:hypothetical protein